MPKPISSTSGASRPNTRVEIERRRRRTAATKRGAELRERARLARAHAAGAHHEAADARRRGRAGLIAGRGRRCRLIDFMTARERRARGSLPIIAAAGGCSSMVERQLPKLHTRVRFPSPAPKTLPSLRGCTCWLNEGGGPRRRCGCRRMPPQRAPRRRAASCPRFRRRAWRLGL